MAESYNKTFNYNSNQYIYIARGYLIYNNEDGFGVSEENSKLVDDLMQGLTYNFSVKAIDLAGNLSDNSNNVTVTMAAYSDTVISSDLILDDNIEYGNLYVNSGTLDLNGKEVKINGNLIQAGGSIVVNSGKLIVNGNYRMQKESVKSSGNKEYTYSSGILKMLTDEDYFM